MNLKSQAILLRQQNLKPKAIHQWFLKHKGLNIHVPTLSTWYNPKNQLVFDAIGLDAFENEDTSINNKKRPQLIQDCEELLTIHINYS